jgi:hypothetical protein
MTPRDRLRARIGRSTDRQVGAAALLLLASVAAIDVVLVAGAAWISYAIVDRTGGVTMILGLAASALLLCCALLATWRVTRGYRNLRRLIDDVRNARQDR